jgi:thiol-disulfide isomerase/thioredoxin
MAALLVAISSLMFATSAPAAATADGGATSEVRSGHAAPTGGWKGKPRLVPVTYPQWVSELHSLHGRIVVVDCWATWCVPCVERFPRMMAMARKWSRSGITFVTLSLDDRDDAASLENVREFLQRQDARLPNYLMDEITPDAFEKLGLLSVPAVLIYDRSGKMVNRLTGDDPNHQFTEAEVERAIARMVGGRGR